MKNFIICLIDNIWYSLDVESLEFCESIPIDPTQTYWTFQLSDFMREIKAKKLKEIPTIINLESYDKQFSQKGKDIYDFKKWHILKALRREEIINSNYKITDIKDFLLKINDLINRLNEQSPDEIPRFKSIEQKINEIVHQASLDGVRIDENILSQKCIDLHKEIYNLKNELQFAYNIFQPENFETQFIYLKSKKYRILDSIERTVSLNRKTDKVCNFFYELNRNVSDLKSLLLLTASLGGKEHVHPYNVGFGTITSRIILKEPSLQNLRKRNRNIIIPNKGKKLLYIDFSQYEASILAHYSEDKNLLELINEQDIYNDIIKNIYCSNIEDGDRKAAKILFYRYLYGDTFEHDAKFKRKVESYFKSFQNLSKFKESLIKESNEKGYVRTSHGNYRQLLPENDNIWILSHYIQSIASYIFKKVLIEVKDKIKLARLIIPLHDGALYEVNQDEYTTIKDQIISIFVETFKKECYSITNIQALECDFYPPDKQNISLSAI